MLQRALISGMALVLGINLLSAATILILIKYFPSFQAFNYSYTIFWFVTIPFLLLIGLTQFLYISPLLIWSISRRKTEFTKGVLIGAGITLLLNGGGCYLIGSLLGVG